MLVDDDELMIPWLEKDAGGRVGYSEPVGQDSFLIHICLDIDYPTEGLLHLGCLERAHLEGPAHGTQGCAENDVYRTILRHRTLGQTFPINLAIGA